MTLVDLWSAMCFANKCAQTEWRPWVWSSQQPVWLSYPLPDTLPAPSLSAVVHKSTSYSSAAAVDLDNSQSFPPGFPLLFQQWVISSAESEKRGKGSWKGWFIQGSRLPRLVPRSSLLTVSPEHMTRLNPKPRRFCVALWLQSHLSLQCSFLLWMSNYVRSLSCVSLRLAARKCSVLCLLRLCLLKTAHVTLSCSSNLFTLLMRVSGLASASCSGLSGSRILCFPEGIFCLLCP